MAYTWRKSSFSAPATVPACHVSPPSVVRRNVPPVPLTQTTLRLTMLNPSRLASVFDFCGCHCAKAGKANNGRTRNTLFNRIGSRSSLVSTHLPHLVPHLLELLVGYHCRAQSSLHTSLNAGTRTQPSSQRGERSLRMTCPSFITNRTRSSSVMSAMGSPDTA